jgi:hypothetical protein
MDFLTLEDGTDKVLRNISNYQSTLCNFSEERRKTSFVQWSRPEIVPSAATLMSTDRCNVGSQMQLHLGSCVV